MNRRWSDNYRHLAAKWTSTAVFMAYLIGLLCGWGLSEWI